MTMEFFKVGANGQMEIDFASLEAITSFKFLAFFKGIIHNGEIIKFECIESEFYFDFKVLAKHVVSSGVSYEEIYFFNYGKFTKSFFESHITVNMAEMLLNFAKFDTTN